MTNAEYIRWLELLDGEIQFDALIDGKDEMDMHKMIWNLCEKLEQEPKTDTLKQIREEIVCAMDMEPAWKGQDNYIGGLQIACSIIDKYRGEVED